MGHSGHTDQPRVRAHTEQCAWRARAQVRKLLRRRHGIDRGIPVVLSTEKPRCKLVDMTGGGNLADFQARVCQLVASTAASNHEPSQPGGTFDSISTLAGFYAPEGHLSSRHSRALRVPHQ